ncbi:hypothetical protein BDQ17DRAFT_1315939 [Cyathus striatus]|nr:hypothetical protein BDQ17DRAFT_1315939 [Cyathus striatus]
MPPGYVRIQWVDLTNVVRYRVLPVKYFKQLLGGTRPGIGISKASFGRVQSKSLAAGFTVMGEYLYVPDLSTLRLCGYAPKHAVVMGWLEEKSPVKTEDGRLSVEADICTRRALQRVVKEAKAISDVDFLVGFESEFILIKSTDPIEAVSYHSCSASRGLASGSVEATVMDEIAEALQLSGIELLMYHAETAPGQYEVVTGPLPPLEAADALVHTRETIFHIAAKHGLRATFAPRIFMQSTGSSAHAHISINSPRSTKYPDNLSLYESSFLAGVLEHLPAIVGFAMPIPASYKRMVDGMRSGGTYVCWGTENRECPIRYTSVGSIAARRYEFRFIDGTANPYLVLAAILGCGHLGIQSNMQLKVKDCPGPQTAANMSEEERNTLSITRRLPLTWEEARKSLSGDSGIRYIFGDGAVKKYLAVNQVSIKLIRLFFPGELTHSYRFSETCLKQIPKVKANV